MNNLCLPGRRRHRRRGWEAQRRIQAVGVAAVAALAAVAIAMFLHQSHALEALELKSVDARFALRGPQAPPPAIVIVGVDAQTFSRLQLQWPFPRSVHARMIEQLKRDGAKVIVYDVQFTEPTTPVNGSRSAQQAAIDQDNALIKAVHDAGNVVLATSEVGPDGENMIFGGEGIVARLGARAGAAMSPPDLDGVDRQMLYSYRHLHTLGVVAAEVKSGRAIPASSLGGPKAWIDFAGPAGTIPEVSFASVLRHEAPASMFAGKTVVVGATVSNLQDVHATPFGKSGLMSGAELTANAIATAADGFPLRPSGGSIALLLIVGFGAFAPLVGLRFSPGTGIAFSAAIGALYVGAAQIAFQAGTILPLSDPLSALVLGCVGLVAADSLGERRRLQALQRALGPLNGDGPQFFISYRKSQSQWPAKIISRALVARFGRASVFIDEAAIDAGVIWPQEIEAATARCSVMLVLIGPDWLDARKPDGTRRLDDPEDWVRREVEIGLGRVDAAIVPVLHDRAEVPSRENLPDSLRALVDWQAIHLTGEDLDADVEALIDSVQSGRMRGYVRRWPSAMRPHA